MKHTVTRQNDEAHNSVDKNTVAQNLLNETTPEHNSLAKVTSSTLAEIIQHSNKSTAVALDFKAATNIARNWSDVQFARSYS